MPLSDMTSQAATGWTTSAVRGAAAGDDAAFTRIVAAHHGDMVRVAYGICGDRDLALDAVQAAWLVAWRKLATLRDPERLRPWLVSVAANEARHLVRRRHPGRVTELDLDRIDAVADEPGDVIRRVDLANALHHLTVDERSLIALRYGAGFDSSEIAPMLHLSPSGVRARLARTLAHLRRELTDV